MKIWIPGAKGMVGQAVARLCESKQISHLKTDRQQVDITDIEQVTAFASTHHPTHIINCAAYTQVDLAEKEEKNAWTVNSVGPKNLGHIAKTHSCHLLHLSTDYLFDGTTTTSYTEEAIPNPLNVYGKSKWEGEKALQQVYPDACILRTSWIFGLEGKNFVKTMLTLMQEKEELSIVDDQWGRPTSSEDLAKALLALCDAKGVYHFANEGKTTWYAFAKEIYTQAKLLGFPLKVQAIHPLSTADYPTAAKRPPNSTLNCDKFAKRTQIKPRSYKEALAYYLQEVRSTPHDK